MTDKEKMYRRQLGGAEAALRRERQRVKALEELVRDMWPLVCKYEDMAVQFDSKPDIDMLAGAMFAIGVVEGIHGRMKELGIEVEE